MKLKFLFFAGMSVIIFSRPLLLEMLDSADLCVCLVAISSNFAWI